MTYDPRYPQQPPPQYPPQYGQQAPQSPPHYQAGSQQGPPGYQPAGTGRQPYGHGQQPYPPADTGAATTSLTISYVLMLAGLVLPFANIVALIIAYVNRGRDGPSIDSHHTWVIRTFWIGLLYCVLSVIAMIVLIGWLLLIGTCIWYLWRMIKGLSALGRREPIPNPSTWWV